MADKGHTQGEITRDTNMEYYKTSEKLPGEENWQVVGEDRGNGCSTLKTGDVKWSAKNYITELKACLTASLVSVDNFSPHDKNL